jgi:iron(III) transport system ATP-binding protein
VTKLLKINGLCVNLQDKAIISDVNLTLSKGDILGLVGPSGCGKTTLLNTIAGFIEQTQGHILIGNSINITPEKNIPPQQRNIGMIFQDYALFPHINVEKNILFGINKLDKHEKKIRLKHLVNLLELTNLEQRFPHQISGGQQQRVAIARALAPQPKLLLLDEPFSNIDARLRNELMLTMRSLLKNLNMTAIFVTHNKDEVFTFADKIAVMHQGTILQTDEPAKVCQQPSNWQVADFLQLGSWIPLKYNAHNEYKTAVGCLNVASDIVNDNVANVRQTLLLKPQFIELSTSIPNNVRVVHISVTEQGYHYLLSSLIENNELSFEKLSFYHNELFPIDKKLAITIKPHELVIFDTD